MTYQPVEKEQITARLKSGTSTTCASFQAASNEGIIKPMSNASNAGQTMPQQIFPSPEEVFLNIGLYLPLPFGDKEDEKVFNIRGYSEKLDLYCPECQQNCLFFPDSKHIPARPGLSPLPTLAPAPRVPEGVFIVEFYCTRIDTHKAYFCFRVQNRNLIKIGQHPSAAALNEDTLKKYRKLLGEERYKEFNRGVGLAAHGIGIGSFVYLRRIFENLVGDAHNQAMTEATWDEEQYKWKRMDEKIGLLSHLLPRFLSENRTVYSILSKGIHELNEVECLSYFSVLKTSIELMLDEKIQEAERQKKIQETRQALSKIKTTLS